MFSTVKEHIPTERENINISLPNLTPRSFEVDFTIIWSTRGTRSSKIHLTMELTLTGGDCWSIFWLVTFKVIVYAFIVFLFQARSTWECLFPTSHHRRTHLLILTFFYLYSMLMSAVLKLVSLNLLCFHARHSFRWHFVPSVFDIFILLEINIHGT